MATASCSEEQVRRWLAFLAQGMRRNNQSIFLLEQVQPDWLGNRAWRFVFTVTSFLIPLCGHYLLLATAFKLCGGHCFAGPPGGTAHSPVPKSQFLLGLVVVAAFFLLGGNAVQLAYRRAMRPSSERIRMVERLGWSFRGFVQPIKDFPGWGCNPILFFPALLVLLIRCLFSGVQTSRMQQTTAPNQGVRSTLRNALLILLPIPTLLLASAPFAPIPRDQLVMGILVLLAFCYPSSWFGSLDVIDHYALRLLLRVEGDAPLNYVRFLDYAAKELGFLQKVGGGYMFLHRSLLDYFAEADTE